MTTITVRAHKRRRPKSARCEEMTLRLQEEVLHEQLVRAVEWALREAFWEGQEQEIAA